MWKNHKRLLVTGIIFCIKFLLAFCWGNQGEANFLVGLKLQLYNFINDFNVYFFDLAWSPSNIPVWGSSPRCSVFPGLQSFPFDPGGRGPSETWSHWWDESQDAQTHLSAAHRIWGWVKSQFVFNRLADFYLLVLWDSNESIVLTGTGSIEIPVLCLLVHGEPRILQVTLNILLIKHI